jgi:hypothetical protein
MHIVNNLQPCSSRRSSRSGRPGWRICADGEIFPPRSPHLWITSVGCPVSKWTTLPRTIWSSALKRCTPAVAPPGRACPGRPSSQPQAEPPVTSLRPQAPSPPTASPQPQSAFGCAPSTVHALRSLAGGPAPAELPRRVSTGLFTVLITGWSEQQRWMGQLAAPWWGFRFCRAGGYPHLWISCG